MATRETTLYAAQKSTRVNAARLPVPNSKKVEFTRVFYTLVAADETENDIINIIALPPGCIPRPELSKVAMSADPGTALTIDIGTAEDVDGWADGMVLDAGGVVECCAPVVPNWFNKTELAADSDKMTTVFATIKTGTTLTTTTILCFILAYELPG